MKLFDSIQLKNLFLKNRIAMASMGTNLSDPEGFVTGEMIAYYAERAKGGAGLVMTELVTVDFPLGNGIERQLSIDDDKYISGLKELTNQIHRYGSKVFIQLNHAGHRAKLEFTRGGVPVSASSIPSNIVKIEPRPLTGEEISILVDAFGRAARRAKEAGLMVSIFILLTAISSVSFSQALQTRGRMNTGEILRIEPALPWKF